MRPIEDPSELPGDGKLSEKILTHPAFGQIRLSRISGQRVLYGSDFKHNEYVSIEIVQSELHRSLSRDWHFGRRHVVTIDMSEAQWAAFVSSFGQGSGVPCTIDTVQGKPMPGFPLRDEGQLFKPEVDSKLAKCIESVDAAIADIDAQTAGMSKTKREAISDRLRRVRMELSSNLPFVAEQFGEHMETRVEKAKIEVDAYVTQTVMRAGLDAIQARGASLAIEAKKETED